MYTYVQRPGCKKENTATYVYIRAGSRTPTRAYVRPGLVYMAGRNGETSSSSCSWGGNRMRCVHGEATECVVFMGRQRNVSCSWGGNGMRRVHREATERVGANRLGRNRMCGRVHREGLDGTGDGNEAWRTAERRKRPCVRPAKFETGSCSSGGVWRTAKRRKQTSYVRNGVLLIGRGVVYRKTEETDLLRSKRGSC